MDKVRDQMGPHRIKAAQLLGVEPGMIDTSTASPPVAGAGSAPAAAGTSAPPVAAATPAAAATPSSDSSYASMMAQLQQIPKLMAQQQQQLAPAPVMPDNMAARLAMIAAAKQGSPT
jgi:hypothetical protein